MRTAWAYMEDPQPHSYSYIFCHRAAGYWREARQKEVVYFPSELTCSGIWTNCSRVTISLPKVCIIQPGKLGACIIIFSFCRWCCVKSCPCIITVKKLTEFPPNELLDQLHIQFQPLNVLIYISLDLFSKIECNSGSPWVHAGQRAPLPEVFGG